MGCRECTCSMCFSAGSAALVIFGGIFGAVLCVGIVITILVSCSEFSELEKLSKLGAV